MYWVFFRIDVSQVFNPYFELHIELWCVLRLKDISVNLTEHIEEIAPN